MPQRQEREGGTILGAEKARGQEGEDSWAESSQEQQAGIPTRHRVGVPRIESIGVIKCDWGALKRMLSLSSPEKSSR